MPKVTIVRSWPDDDQIHVSIEVADDHPEGLLTEAARVTAELYADALGITLAAVEDDAETDGL
jgi:hypothetical protein